MDSDSTLYLDDDYNIQKRIDIEEITRDDFFDLYKDIIRDKPKQFPVNEFCIRQCENGGCTFEGVIHKRQQFCPICYHLMTTLKDDANIGYDDIIQTWIKRKNCLENIINGNLIKFVDDFNDNYEGESAHIFEFGDEVLVDD